MMKCPFLCKWNTWQLGCTKPTLERCPHGRAVDCLCGAGRVSNETQPGTDPKPETKAGDIIYGGGGGGGTMREILFRGKWEYDDQWFEGYLVKAVGGECMILPITTEHWGGAEFSACYHCDPATVGQYTGLTDKNGKKIFEGDIVDIGEMICTVNGQYLVVYSTTNHCWALERSVVHHHHYFTFSDLNGFAESCEVIGNIHDNPELLEEEG